MLNEAFYLFSIQWFLLGQWANTVQDTAHQLSHQFFSQKYKPISQSWANNRGIDENKNFEKMETSCLVSRWSEIWMADHSFFQNVFQPSTWHRSCNNLCPKCHVPFSFSNKCFNGFYYFSVEAPLWVEFHIIASYTTVTFS